MLTVSTLKRQPKLVIHVSFSTDIISTKRVVSSNHSNICILNNEPNNTKKNKAKRMKWNALATV